MSQNEGKLPDNIEPIGTFFQIILSLNKTQPRSRLKNDKHIIKKASKERNSNLPKLLSLPLSSWCSAALSLSDALLLKLAGIYRAGSALLNFLSPNNGFSSFFELARMREA